jgi:hypothetical protein
MLVADPARLYLYQNRWMELMRSNLINRIRKEVLYSLKGHVFLVQGSSPTPYQGYSHHASHVIQTQNLLDRPDLSAYLLSF